MIVPAHISHDSITVQILSGLFGIILALLLLVCAFLVTFVFVNLVTGLLQQIWPAFLRPKHSITRDESLEEVREANRKTAYDFIQDETRRRRQQAANVSQAEFGRFKDLVEARLQEKLAATRAGKVTEENTNGEEWDLNSLRESIPVETKKINRTDSELKDKAQFSLVTFPEGPKGPPRYLCMKLNSASSTSGKGLRVAFADLPQMAIRLDHDSAHRLAGMIPHTFVAPINAAARRWVRNAEPMKVKSATA